MSGINQVDLIHMWGWPYGHICLAAYRAERGSGSAACGSMLLVGQQGQWADARVAHCRLRAAYMATASCAQKAPGQIGSPTLPWAVGGGVRGVQGHP